MSSGSKRQRCPQTDGKATETPAHAAAHCASPLRLADMHCHLDWIAQATAVADEARERGVSLLCTPVTPCDTLAARKRFATHPNVRVGVGLHPWWIEDSAASRSLIDQAVELASTSSFIGEVGLDFSPAHTASAHLQAEAFERLARACAEHPRPGRTISIHAVRSAETALDILERTGLITHAHCIFHRFSGTSDDLARLRAHGCYVSVNERMLATKRGREYARQMPLGRLLLETDAPARAGVATTIDALEGALMRTAAQLSAIHGIELEQLLDTIAETSARLLNLA